jgi:hypothetical protein
MAEGNKFTAMLVNIHISIWCRNMDMAKDYLQPPSDFFKYKHDKQMRQYIQEVWF